MSRSSIIAAALGVWLSVAATAQTIPPSTPEHNDHGAVMMHAGMSAGVGDTTLPAGAPDAAARLAASPRHREWVMIAAGGGDSVGAWVFYPQRKTKAPVVVVIHEIFGVTTWAKGVGDQLAAEGFIAIVPDLLTGQQLPTGADSLTVEAGIKAVSMLKREDVQRRIIATANYGMQLPAALHKYGVVGFCWGGSVSFAHAALGPDVNASVVYYGTSPDSTLIGQVHAPVLGLYAGMDARVGMTIPAADSAFRAMKKTYDHFSFEGAGHGFMRDQAGMTGANLKAAQQSWPKAIAWFRLYLEK